jgi:hypothetical protein
MQGRSAPSLFYKTGNLPWDAFKKLAETELLKAGNDDVYRRKIFAHCYAYMESYRDGLTGKAAEKQTKVYRSHRRVEQSL